MSEFNVSERWWLRWHSFSSIKFKLGHHCAVVYIHVVIISWVIKLCALYPNKPKGVVIISVSTLLIIKWSLSGKSGALWWSYCSCQKRCYSQIKVELQCTPQMFDWAPCLGCRQCYLCLKGMLNREPDFKLEVWFGAICVLVVTVFWELKRLEIRILPLWIIGLLQSDLKWVLDTM